MARGPLGVHLIPLYPPGSKCAALRVGVNLILVYFIRILVVRTEIILPLQNWKINAQIQAAHNHYSTVSSTFFHWFWTWALDTSGSKCPRRPGTSPFPRRVWGAPVSKRTCSGRLDSQLQKGNFIAPRGNGVKVNQLGWRLHSSPLPNFKLIEQNGAKVSEFVKSEPKRASIKFEQNCRF